MAGPVEEFSTSRGSNVFASFSKFRLLIHFSLTSRNSISFSTLCIKPSFTSTIPCSRSSGYMSAASSPVDPHSNQIQIPLSQEVSHAKVSTFESQHQLWWEPKRRIALTLEQDNNSVRNPNFLRSSERWVRPGRATSICSVSDPTVRVCSWGSQALSAPPSVPLPATTLQSLTQHTHTTFRVNTPFPWHQALHAGPPSPSPRLAEGFLRARWHVHSPLSHFLFVSISLSCLSKTSCTASHTTVHVDPATFNFQSNCSTSKAISIF